jgi:drug/metabolite transporter (DMT)-like permease
VMAMVCSAEGYVLGRRFRGLHPITTTAVAMPIGAVLLFCWSQLVGESLGLPSSASAILAFAYNVVLGSVGLFALYFWLLRTWGAVRTSYMFLIAPMVAVALGFVLLHERLSLALVVGSALVLSGVYVGVLRQAPAAASAEDGGDLT